MKKIVLKNSNSFEIRKRIVLPDFLLRPIQDLMAGDHIHHFPGGRCQYFPRRHSQ